MINLNYRHLGIATLCGLFYIPLLFIPNFIIQVAAILSIIIYYPISYYEIYKDAIDARRGE